MRNGVIADRYRLERRLGHGSMGDVWLARDEELERDVALKLLAPDADHARFEREARAAAALSHPNVTRLYDYGESDGRPYIALEYLPGGSLEDRLPAGHRLQDDEATAIAAQLAAGLAHAHEHGLVHRDLKPANILFDNEDRPKIADFGIAWISGGSTLTDAGTVLGTAAYISPEQAAGEPATPASDVYSFGVILFRMLTGRLPFEAESPLELADMHRRLDAPPVELIRPDAPAPLAAVAASALARDPRDRLPDGTALAAALDLPATAGRPADAATLVLARPPRVQRRFALAAALLLLLATAGISAALFLTHESSKGHSATVPTHARTATRPTTSTPVASPTSAPTSTTRPTTSAPPPTTSTAPATTTTLETSTTAPQPTTVATTATPPAP